MPNKVTPKNKEKALNQMSKKKIRKPISKTRRSSCRIRLMIVVSSTESGLFADSAG